jgi:hypothetical protein
MYTYTHTHTPVDFFPVHAAFFGSLLDNVFVPVDVPEVVVGDVLAEAIIYISYILQVAVLKYLACWY